MLATSDAAIRQRTGRGWEEWLDLLDEAGMAERPHREIARWVATRLGVAPLAWAAQAVTVSFERARGGRAAGQQPDGFTVTASRTVHVPTERLFHALCRPGRTRALASRRGTARADHDQAALGPLRLGRWQYAGKRHLPGEGKAVTVTVAHTRLADAAAAAEMKAWWRTRLTTLKAQLEGGESDA